MKGVLLSIILLPGTVIVLVPSFLLYTSSVFFRVEITFPGNAIGLVASFFFFVFGVTLVGTTIHLFIRDGKGTLALWAPPRALVVKGPYRYVRNPMIIGVLCILVGEALLAWSVILALWTLIFFAANTLYFPLIEEPKLRKRFGKEFDDYARSVPRWIPRLTPWE